MNLHVLCRKIADAQGVSLGEGAQVVQNVLTCVAGDLQEVIVPKMLIGVKKGVADEGGPYHGGQAFWARKKLATGCPSLAKQPAETVPT
jgi:hypothetical protein